MSIRSICIKLYKLAFSTEDQQLQEKILSSNDPKKAYFFALNTPGADIPVLQQIVVKAKSAALALLFALNIPGAQLDTLEPLVNKYGTPGQRGQMKSLFLRKNKK